MSKALSQGKWAAENVFLSCWHGRGSIRGRGEVVTRKQTSSNLLPELQGTPSSAALTALVYSVIETRIALPSPAQAKAALISVKGNVWEMIRSKG